MIDPNIDFGYDEHQYQRKRSSNALDAATVCVQGLLLTVISVIVYTAVLWAVS